MYQLFFDEESIYEISKLYLNKFCNGRTDGRMHARGIIILVVLGIVQHALMSIM